MSDKVWEASYTTELSPTTSSSSQHSYKEDNTPEMYQRAGGEKMSNTTEPDPGSEIAVQKTDTVDEAAMSKEAGDKCPHCGQAMAVEKSGDEAMSTVTKTDDMDADDMQKMEIEIEISPEEEDTAEPDEEESSEAEVEKADKPLATPSVWGGAFLPLK